MLYESIALPTELRWREDTGTLPVKQTAVKAGFPIPALVLTVILLRAAEIPARVS